MPDRHEAFAFVGLLKDCAKKKDLQQGSALHADILDRRILHGKSGPYVGSALISMYAKCGALAKARRVLETLPVRNVVSWNALIAGYAQQGQGREAILCFQKMMQTVGISPDEVTFICILKACGSTRAFEDGTQIRDEISRRGLLKTNVVLGNALVDMYVKCGLLAQARQVLEELPARDVVSWSAIIAGYANEGQGHEALNCFEQMQREGISPNNVTFICILKACGCIGAIDKGKQIHDEIVSRDMLSTNIILGTALVDMYAKCGVFAKAQEVLEQLPVSDVIAWNALIAGYAQNGQGHEALNCYMEMTRKGLRPNEVTLSCILKACGSSGAIDKGKQVHEEIISRGLLKSNVVLGTALVDMYVKCGLLAKAQEVLNELPVRDIITWNSLVAGYTQSGKCHEAWNCLIEMQREGLTPNDVTFICILKACGSTRAINKGKQMHKQILDWGLLENNIILGTALVDMYAKCGLLTKAQEVLEDLPLRNVISWNALIAGYAQEEQGREALNCLAQMRREGHVPNEITFTCILKACGSIGAVDKGQEIHDEIINGGFLEKHIELGTALVDMYARCGIFAKAWKILRELPAQYVASWNALIAGYTQQGYYDEALDCFGQMQSEGLSPNEVTFVSILNACSHSKKLDEAQMYYENMSQKYGIIPKLEHHTCMVVAFGCAGHFDKAMSVIKTMPSFDDPSVWLALLDACRKWGNVEVGRLAFDQAIEKDNNLATAYIIMANIYTAAGMQENAEKIEAMKAKIGFGRSYE